MTKKPLQPQLQVVLANEDSLRNYLSSVFTEELDKAIELAGMNSKVLNTTQISKALGISPTTLRQYEKMGLPFGNIKKRKFYDLKECKKWITTQQID